MRRTIQQALALLGLILLAACSRTPRAWHADVTEWILGLPMDNICALAEPMALTPQPETFVHQRMSGILLRESEQAPKGSLHIAADTRVELICAYLLPDAVAQDKYTVQIELRLPERDGAVGLRLPVSAQKESLPALVNPDTHKPLRLSLKDALEYADKKRSKN